MDENLPDLVKQITIHYIKFYYEKFSKDFPNSIVPEIELRKFVNDMYEKKTT